MNRGRALRQLAEIFRNAAPASPDWTAILALANAQLITPELLDQLEHVGARDSVPGELRAFMEDVRVRTQTRNARLADTLDDALAAFNAADIEPILLKGCGVWVGATPARNRIVSDLDLLVRPGEMQAAVTSLVRIGFKVVEDRRGDSFHQSVVLERPSDVGQIDLHQHPPGPASHPPAIDVREDSHRVQFRGRAALLPSPEAQILIAVLHDQFQDGRFWRGGFDLRHLLDIAALAGAKAGVDWERLVGLCPTAIVGHAMLSQLWAAKRIVAARIPERAVAWGWGKLNYQRQRAQFVWPALNAPFHRLGLNKNAWMRMSSQMTGRGAAAKDPRSKT